MTTHDKLLRLQETIRGYGTLAVAFSGGVDSCFLLHVAHETLGERALALTVDSVFIPRDEILEAESFCRERGIRQQILRMDPLAIPGVAANPPDRCYLCKSTIFSLMRQEAERAGCAALADGSNADDVGDYRPGMRALRELGIRSPLMEAGLGKSEIRALSREMGLPCWDKPSAACLASRVAYGETLTVEKLRAVEKAEELLHTLGIRQCRVRVHGKTARIEVPPADFPSILPEENRRRIVSALKDCGFSYVSLDLEGFRSGSMNEILKK